MRPRRQGLALLCGPSTSPLDVRSLSPCLVLLCATWAALASEPGAKPFQFDSPIGIVMKLYHDYAFGAVMDQNVPYAPVENQPRAVLERYFDPFLTNRFLAEQRCAETSGGICNLDFQPMWNSKDTIATSVEISASEKPEDIVVTLNMNRTGQKSRLIYHLAKTSRGWRIHDIEGDDWSLLGILSGHYSKHERTSNNRWRGP